MTNFNTVLLGLVFLCSCSGSSATATEGAVTGACYSNGTCNSGLTCASGLCVNLETAETGSETSTPDTSTTTAQTTVTTADTATTTDAAVATSDSADTASDAVPETATDTEPPCSVNVPMVCTVASLGTNTLTTTNSYAYPAGCVLPSAAACTASTPLTCAECSTTGWVSEQCARAVTVTFGSDGTEYSLDCQVISGLPANTACGTRGTVSTVSNNAGNCTISVFTPNVQDAQ